MFNRGLVMMGSVLGIPLLAQMSPETAVEKLAIGTSQMILAIVVVAESVAIAAMFLNWRRDVERNREESRLAGERLTELIARNTAVIEQNKDAGHRHSAALERFERSVTTFAEVIRKCENK